MEELVHDDKFVMPASAWQVVEGVFKGDNGEWICGFSKGGSCSAYVAELRGVFEGLKLARLVVTVKWSFT
uniref:Uncharacterized protein n=1 Tax=Medicago truncatula TaxID=3880 RepID=A2Q1Z8_MEDTR|nr:hypothetical protein MtrDRAFT_AC149134g35v2 [Medicago truncatula]